MTRCKPDRDGIACLTHSRLLVGLSYCSDGCRHERVLHVQLFPSKSEVLVRHDECQDCGEWLSLGPSNDDDERVRVEIRAAELGVYAWAGRKIGQARLMHDAMSAPEYVGYLQYMRPVILDGHTQDLDTNETQAGYLAAAIASHEEES